VTDPAGEIELAIVTMTFDAADPDRLLSHLARYVVLARGAAGCRNVDLAVSTTAAARFVVVQKWDDADAARDHFDSDLMVEMAEGCQGLLTGAPVVDLLDGLSAHDLA
jgi:quinol monooxygenase YgiN